MTSLNAVVVEEERETVLARNQAFEPREAEAHA
jgi:hypothetical protein